MEISKRKLTFVTAVFALSTLLLPTQILGGNQDKKADWQKGKEYKKEKETEKKAAPKYKSTEKKDVWLPGTRVVEKKSDLNGIPKGRSIMVGKKLGRPQREENIKSDLGIDQDSKKRYRETFDFKPGPNGVKKVDLKATGSKSGVSRYVTQDKIPDKDIKNKKITKLR